MTTGWVAPGIGASHASSGGANGIMERGDGGAFGAGGDETARLAAALEAAGDGAWDWDVPTGAVWFSEGWAAMLGYRREALAPHVSTWEQLLHPRDREPVLAQVAMLLDGRLDRYQMEHRLRRADGTWAWVLDRGRVVARDASGRALRATGTHAEVTLRKEVEEGRRVAQLDADRQVRELRLELHRARGVAGIVPVCMDCHRLRSGAGEWLDAQAYLAGTPGVELSHGICPDCDARRGPPVR